MPKGKKRKNPGVGVDFKRVRSKVGKKLPKAQNQTDTTFKSRAINLPGQNIRDEGTTGVAVTQRNLNLKEVLAQIGHYSDKVRRDALTGLSELLSAHPREAHKAPRDILEALSMRMTDSDTQVRRALPPLFRDVLLPALKGCDASAFLPLIMAHLCSAMSHITDAVRIDALAMLEVLMCWAPAEIVDAHLAPCLSVYAHMLSPTQRSRSVHTQSIASLHKTAGSLRAFLKTSADAGSPTYLPTSAPKGSATGALHAYKLAWPPRSALFSAEKEGAGGEGGRATLEMGLLDLTQKVLEGWMECAPSQLALQPDVAAAKAMRELLGCANLLLDQLQQSQAGDEALDSSEVELAVGKKGKRQRLSLRAAILKVVAPHFPVALASDAAPDELKDACGWINLNAAQMLQRLFNKGSAVEEWMQRVVAYWVGVFKDSCVLRNSNDGAAIRPPSPEVLDASIISALVGCEASLLLLSPYLRSTLVSAVQQLSANSPAKSAVRSTCLRFQQRLLTRAVAVSGGVLPEVETQCDDSDVRSSQLLTEEEVARWLGAIPRMLWELGSDAPDASGAALQLLLCVGHVARADSPLLAALDKLQSQLIPLFMLSLPGKSATNKKGGVKTKSSEGKKELLFASPGPLVELPSRTQRLAVDLLWYLPSLSEPMLRAVLMMALVREGRSGKRGGATAYPLELALRAVEVVIRRCQQSDGRQACVDGAAYLSFLLSLLAGDASQLRPAEHCASPTADAASQDRQHRYWSAQAELACTAARAVTSPGCSGFLPLLLPPLTRLLVAVDSTTAGRHGTAAAADSDERGRYLRLWYGALTLVDAALDGIAEEAALAELTGLAPHLMVAYACESHTLAEDPSAAARAGLELSIRVLSSRPALCGDLLLTAVAAATDTPSPSGMPPAVIPGAPTVHLATGAQLVGLSALLTRVCQAGPELKEELLTHAENLDSAVAALRAAAEVLGEASAEGAAARSACSRLSAVVDTLLGRL